MLKRFHKEVFFEEGVEEEIRELLSNSVIQPSKHFLDNWVKRGKICIPTKKMLEEGTIFEYYRGVASGKIDRYVIRCTKISDEYDVIFVVNNHGVLVTSWVNTKEEQHENLRRELYCDGTENTGIVLQSERKSSAKRSKTSGGCEALIREWKRKKYRSGSKASWNL